MNRKLACLGLVVAGVLPVGCSAEVAEDDEEGAAAIKQEDEPNCDWAWAHSLNGKHTTPEKALDLGFKVSAPKNDNDRAFSQASAELHLATFTMKVGETAYVKAKYFDSSSVSDRLHINVFEGEGEPLVDSTPLEFEVVGFKCDNPGSYTLDCSSHGRKDSHAIESGERCIVDEKAKAPGQTHLSIDPDCPTTDDGGTVVVRIKRRKQGNDKYGTFSIPMGAS